MRNLLEERFFKQKNKRIGEKEEKLLKKFFGVLVGLWAVCAFVALIWLAIDKGPEMRHVPILLFVLIVFCVAVRLMFGRGAMWVVATWLSGLTAFYSGIFFALLKMSDAGARIKPDGYPLEATSTYVVLGVLTIVGFVFALFANEMADKAKKQDDNYERLFGRPAPNIGSRLLK